jgi:hypothetical protein
LKFPLHEVGVGSIYEENEKLILGFVKSLISFFQIEDKRFVLNTKFPKQEILEVLNKNLEKLPGKIQISDFKTW